MRITAFMFVVIGLAGAAVFFLRDSRDGIDELPEPRNESAPEIGAIPLRTPRDGRSERSPSTVPAPISTQVESTDESSSRPAPSEHLISIRFEAVAGPIDQPIGFRLRDVSSGSEYSGLTDAQGAANIAIDHEVRRVTAVVSGDRWRIAHVDDPKLRNLESDVFEVLSRRDPNLLIPLESPTTIGGRVLDATRLTPVSGVRVLTSRCDDLLSRPAESITGDDGSYEIRGLTGGWHIVRVASEKWTIDLASLPRIGPSYSPFDAIAKLRSEERVLTIASGPQLMVFTSLSRPARSVDIFALQSCRISGRVVSSSGEAIVGADVRLEWENSPLRWAANFHDPARRKPEAKSDSTGRFEVDNAPEGKWRLRADYRDYPPAFTQELNCLGGTQTSDLVITLSPGSAVNVKVVDDIGIPVAGARIRADRNRIFSSPKVDSVEAVSTGADGVARFKRLSPGMVYLNFSNLEAQGFVLPLTTKVDYEVASEPMDITIVVARAAKLLVRIVDESDRPIENSWVYIEQVLLDGGVRTNATPQRTNSAGDVEWHVPADGVFRVSSATQPVPPNPTAPFLPKLATVVERRDLRPSDSASVVRVRL